MDPAAETTLMEAIDIAKKQVDAALEQLDAVKSAQAGAIPSALEGALSAPRG